jgi:trk system potassium uptake protein TrkH
VNLAEGSQRFVNLLDVRHWRLTPYQILSLGFAGLILCGAFLLTFPASTNSGKGTPFIDALFTATSAVCVTGLVTVDTGTHYSVLGQMIIILLIQIGGLGIMTLATLFALLIGKRINLRERLLMQESLNQLTVSGIVRLTRYIIFSTLVIEFIGGTILAVRWFDDLGWKGVYYGYWHSVSSFCNAGFDLFGPISGKFSSLTSYVDDFTVNFTVTTLIILGGIGFGVLYDIWTTRRFSRLALHSKLVLVTSGILIVAGMGLIMAFEWTNPDTLEPLTMKGKLLASYFQSVTPRTAGYNTIDIGKMHEETIFLTIILMFIGASPASTGGGIKTSTAAVLFLAAWSMIRGRSDAECFERRIPKEFVYKAFSVAFIAFILVTVVTMALAITEKAPFLKVLFEVTSAFGTVGLTTGITPDLTTAGKLWLIFTMFAGRVGPVTVALALAMRMQKAQIQYPEGKTLIG